MTASAWTDVAFGVFAAAAVFAGWRVFRTDSMVRASFFLLSSLVASAAIMLLLAAEYLGFALIFMMGLEMTVMALFMVAFMMNPGGLNPMTMVHQKPVALVAGWVVFVGLAAVGLLADFPDQPVTAVATAIEELGVELLGDSMLVFESAGITLLATMIGAVALSSRRGRYEDADAGSVPPPLDPGDGQGEAHDQQAGTSQERGGSA